MPVGAVIDGISATFAVEIEVRMRASDGVEVGFLRLFAAPAERKRLTIAEIKALFPDARVFDSFADRSAAGGGQYSSSGTFSRDAFLAASWSSGEFAAVGPVATTQVLSASLSLILSTPFDDEWGWRWDAFFPPPYLVADNVGLDVFFNFGGRTYVFIAYTPETARASTCGLSPL